MQPNAQPLVIEGVMERAKHLVLEFLKVGPRSAREFLAAAEGATISMRTIQRAAISLGVLKEKLGFSSGWTWRLPNFDDDTAKASSEQPVSSVGDYVEVTVSVTAEPLVTGMLKDAKVEPRVERGDPAKHREISDLSRAKVIAARIRRLEEIRGRKAPIYAQDPRVIRWADLGIRDPDLREAYERAVTALEETRSQAFVSVGFLDPFVMHVITEGDKAYQWIRVNSAN